MAPTFDFPQRGSILLSVSVIIFLISLTAAGGAWYVRQSRQLTDTALPSLAPAPDSLTAVLDPTVTVDRELESERANLHKNLITPLRQYYATKDERLAAIHVAPLPVEDEDEVEDTDNTERARVSLRVIPPEGEEQTISFRYDLTPWTPSMLDNE